MAALTAQREESGGEQEVSGSFWTCCTHAQTKASAAPEFSPLFQRHACVHPRRNAPTSSLTNPVALGGAGIFLVLLHRINVTLTGADRAGRTLAETQRLF